MLLYLTQLSHDPGRLISPSAQLKISNILLKASQITGPSNNIKDMNIYVQQVGAAARSTVVSTQGLTALRDNIVTVFGAKTADAMVPLEVEGPNGTSISGCVP